MSGLLKICVYIFSFFGEGILGYVRSSRGPACSLMASCCRDISSLSSCIWSLSCSNSCSRLLVTCMEKWQLYTVYTWDDTKENDNHLIAHILCFVFLWIQPQVPVPTCELLSYCWSVPEAKLRNNYFSSSLQMECLTCNSCSRFSWSSSFWRNCSSSTARSSV